MMKSGVAEIMGKNDNFLTIVLDNGDDIIKCIEASFQEQGIKKAHLVYAEGRLKDTRIATSKSGVLRQRTYSEPLKIKQVAGEFNRVNNDYFGDVNISLAKDPIHAVSGVLLQGFADGEVTIRFKIIADLSYSPENINKKKSFEEMRNDKKEPAPFLIS
jgi:predicted DNA-binding protein with PD1-like motif